MLGNSEKVSKFLELHFVDSAYTARRANHSTLSSEVQNNVLESSKPRPTGGPSFLSFVRHIQMQSRKGYLVKWTWLKQHGGSNKTMAAWTLLLGHYPSADYPSRLTAQKMRFSIKDFFSKAADLVTFTEEILNAELHFLCSNFSQRKSPKIGKSLVQHQGTSTQARQTQGVQIDRD